MEKVLFTRPTRTIELPSYPKSEVTIYTTFQLGEVTSDFQKFGENFQLLAKYMPKLIKSWNFVDTNGKDLEINEENCKLLGLNDVNFIFSQIQLGAQEEKKS